MVTTDRIDAADALVKIFRARYPERGFSFSSEKLKFDHTEERGLRIVAKSAIRKDETLMVIPSAECLGIGEFSRFPIVVRMIRSVGAARHIDGGLVDAGRWTGPEVVRGLEARLPSMEVHRRKLANRRRLHE